MDNHSNVRLDLHVSVDTEQETIELRVECTNTSVCPVRVPREFSVPDPFRVHLSTPADDRSDHTSSHTFSFLANPHSSVVLAPAESRTLKADLLFLFSSLEKGNHTLRVDLDMTPYLISLGKKHPETEALEPSVVTQSNAASFFVPWALHSERWDRYLRMAHEQQAKYSFRWWKPWTWRQLAARKEKWPPQ